MLVRRVPLAAGHRGPNTSWDASPQDGKKTTQNSTALDRPHPPGKRVLQAYRGYGSKQGRTARLTLLLAHLARPARYSDNPPHVEAAVRAFRGTDSSNAADHKAAP